LSDVEDTGQNADNAIMIEGNDDVAEPREEEEQGEENTEVEEDVDLGFHAFSSTY
jgi:hypothetical protein